VFYYELREGDDDIFSDLLLTRDEEMAAPDFFALVTSIRDDVVDGYEADTLIEAIAEVLERDHGFTFVSDDRLSASVNVSESDEETYLVESGQGSAGADYRGILVDWDPTSEAGQN
jgi:hypothetical protein